MRFVNEKSGREFQAWFESNPGEPTVPSTVHWCLRNNTHDATVQEWVELEPVVVSANGAITGVKATVDVPGSLHVLTDRNNRREEFELQVVAAKDTAREYSEVLPYYVVRMSGR